MRAEHACLCHALAVVIRERDLAVKEKHQLQAKLENLEQVLKVGRGHPGFFRAGAGQGAAGPQSREGLRL